jgi:hypothetical protein
MRKVSAQIDYDMYCGVETMQIIGNPAATAEKWINYTIDRDTRWRGTDGTGTVTTNTGFFQMKLASFN